MSSGQILSKRPWVNILYGVLFGLLIVGTGAFLFNQAQKTAAMEQQFTEAQTVSGTVLETYERDKKLMVRYSYELEDGRNFSSTERVSQQYFENIPSPLTVYYLPDNPEASRLERTDDAGLLMAGSIVFVIVGVAFMVLPVVFHLRGGKAIMEK